MYRPRRGESWVYMYRNFCADSQLYHRSINAEESQTGLPSTRPRNLDADQVLQTDAHARAEYIQREFFRVKGRPKAHTTRSAGTPIPLCRDHQGARQVDCAASIHCQDVGQGDSFGSEGTKITSLSE
jgi:hypothetical protein